MRVLDTIAPFETAQEWDNVGVMVGDLMSDVSTIVVALDPSLEVIGVAQETGAELIVTHHPLIFRPITRIDLQDAIARKIAILLCSGINLVSMHTNLDKAEGGVADELAKRLGLSDCRPYGYMRLGTIGTPSPLIDWLKQLPFSSAKIIDAGRDVFMVAACPGSGMDSWRSALEMGCDTFVTGDVRYHAGMDARDAGMNVVDLGHFGTEEIMVKPLAERLERELKGIRVLAYQGRDIFCAYHN